MQPSQIGHDLLNGIVCIKFLHRFPLEGERGGSGEATGFIVDAERGYILTNRHVVGVGPCQVTCIFRMNEECSCEVVYADPTHDYAFLQFDPRKVKHMEIQSISLKPEKATVGAEIFVMGNDAGQKLSIAPGILSRLDFNAPEYSGPYRDCNTNYLIASTNTAAGASGSPVVDVDGSAVGLACGSSSTTTFLLPLDQPLRTLHLLKSNVDVPRGHIGALFKLTPFHECKNNGLTDDVEMEMRRTFPNVTSLLTVQSVLPQGPSHGKLETGDVLVKIGHTPIAQFEHLARILDNNVAREVKLHILRSGRQVSINATVANLHQATPDRFIAIAGAIFHKISFSTAIRFVVPLSVLCISRSAGPLSIKGDMLLAVDGKPLESLESLMTILSTMERHSQFTITSSELGRPHSRTNELYIYDVEEHQKLTLFVRNRVGWVADQLSGPSELEKELAAFETGICIGDNPKQIYRGKLEHFYASIVHVESRVRAQLDCHGKETRQGKGIVVHGRKGLVLVSQSTVAHELCAITVTDNGGASTPAKVVFLDKLRGFVILQCSPSFTSHKPSAILTDTKPSLGAEVLAVCYENAGHAMYLHTTVTMVGRGPTPEDGASFKTYPRNEFLEIDSKTGRQCNTGFLLTKDLKVLALWNKAYGGTTLASAFRVISQYYEGIDKQLGVLPFNVEALPLRSAVIHGISMETFCDIETAGDPKETTMTYRVCKQIICDSSKVSLCEGDIILKMDDKPCVTISDVFGTGTTEPSTALVLRNGAEMRVQVQPIPMTSMAAKRLLLFNGAAIQSPHLDARLLFNRLYSSVLVGSVDPCSAAAEAGMRAYSFITSVNGTSIGTLDDFVKAVNDKTERLYDTIHVVGTDEKPRVCYMRRCHNYYGNGEYVRQESMDWRWLGTQDERVRLSISDPV